MRSGLTALVIVGFKMKNVSNQLRPWHHCDRGAGHRLKIRRKSLLGSDRRKMREEMRMALRFIQANEIVLEQERDHIINVVLVKVQLLPVCYTKFGLEDVVLHRRY
jgi:hypothetical protein